MRLSQKYADHGAELLAIQQYITESDGSPTDDATRLGISTDEVTYENTAGRGPFSSPVKSVII